MKFLLNSKFNFFIYCLVFLFYGNINAEVNSDPLPSWQNGTAKNSIIQFVKDVIQKDGENFIPQEERIATFDQDGTLWVEQPIYTQLFFAIDRVKIQASKHPEWQYKEPFKSILSNDHKALKKLTEKDIELIIAATHTGMSVDEFQKIVSAWLEKSIHPKFRKPFTDLVYQPMLEVIQLLKLNGFKTYIVSGGGQEFMRVYAEKVYGIPPEQIIGSTGKVKYEYRNGQPILLKLPEVLFIDDKTGKPEAINLFIGRRPIAAFGNSTGDQQMLEWTQGSKGKHLELLVHHDDAEREYAYGEDSKIGTFSKSLMDEAREKGWIVVSMKNDWKTIFPQK